MLNVSNLHVSYGESEVLHGLDFKVAPSEIVAIMGRNGMGKTTLMKSLMGIVPTKSGSVTVGETDITRLKSYERVANGVAYVPQGRMIFSTMTVQENIETGLIPRGEQQGARRHLRAVPGAAGDEGPARRQPLRRPAAAARHRPRARDRPKVLLLDEPTEGIQPSIIREMARTLKRIRDERGLSIVVSEQVLSFALDIADRVLVIENGEIVHENLRAEVDEAKVARFLSV